MEQLQRGAVAAGTDVAGRRLGGEQRQLKADLAERSGCGKQTRRGAAAVGRSPEASAAGSNGNGEQLKRGAAEAGRSRGAAVAGRSCSGA